MPHTAAMLSFCLKFYEDIRIYSYYKPFTAVVISIVILRITTPCGLVGESQIYGLHLKEESVIFIRNILPTYLTKWCHNPAESNLT